MTETLSPLPAVRASEAVGPPVLTPALRSHLGKLLADAYATGSEYGGPPEPFVALLAKLEASLDQAHDHADEPFKTELLALAPALRRFAQSLTRNASAADDLVQDTLLRAWRSRARFELGTNMERWAFTILRNCFYTTCRKAREDQDDDGAQTARLTSLPEQGGRLDLQDVQAALAQIPAPMREALVLVAIENLSYEEVAEIQGCLVGTVKSRVWRARDRLAKRLGLAPGEIGQDDVMISAAGPIR